MSVLAKRATVYLQPKLHKAIKLKAAETNCSISDIVNNAIQAALAEDAEDLHAFEQRKNEPLVSFENMLKELKKDGLI